MWPSCRPICARLIHHGFAPQYPEPPFGPPAFTGYDLRYPAAPYVYQYTYQYPYYVYYVVPWPRWPAGY